VLEYRISRESIYDYYLWSPYDIIFDPNWETGTADCAGGKIHTNQNIILRSTNWGDYGVRLNAISELSTGKDCTIKYDSCQYGRPNWVDHYGGVSNDGTAPLLDLSYPHHWIGADEANWWPYDEGWWNGYPISTDPNVWPPLDWRNTDSHFKGSPDQWAIENARIQIVKKDSSGNVLFDASGNPIILATVELPSHLSQQWDWDKYESDPPTWLIEKPVVFVDVNGNPADLSYWSQLQADFPDLIDLDILDGVYGNEGETVPVKNLNTNQQDTAWDAYALNPPRNTSWNPNDADWNEFINSKALQSVVFTNDDGFELEEPKFADTYKRLAQKDGIYLSLAADTACTD
jgi:hypothetical protein